jgi:hypothetical protein
MSLDGDLAAWAAAVRLPDAAVDDIYQQIVGTPAPGATPGLDPAWWRRFTADFTDRMIASTRPVRMVTSAAPVSRAA